MDYRAKEFFNKQKMEISKILNRNQYQFDCFYCKNAAGNVIVDTVNVIEQVAVYFENMYKAKDQDTTNDHYLEEMYDTNNEIYEHLNDPFTITELKNAIKSLPNKKAPGPSELPNELIKLLDFENMNNIMLKFLNQMHKAPQFSSRLNEANVILIPKKEDWEGDLGNLRPITLINTVKKLFSSMFTARLTRILN